MKKNTPKTPKDLGKIERDMDQSTTLSSKSCRLRFKCSSFGARSDGSYKKCIRHVFLHLGVRGKVIGRKKMRRRNTKMCKSAYLWSSFDRGRKNIILQKREKIIHEEKEGGGGVRGRYGDVQKGCNSDEESKDSNSGMQWLTWMAQIVSSDEDSKNRS